MRADPRLQDLALHTCCPTFAGADAQPCMISSGNGLGASNRVGANSAENIG
jgi:hypothetical protein